MAKALSKAARDALAATDWSKIDAMTDEDLARQIASNPDFPPDMALEINVRAIRRAAGMTQAEFYATYEFSIRTVQEWERGAKKPSGPARTLLRATRPTPRACESPCCRIGPSVAIRIAWRAMVLVWRGDGRR